MTIASSAPVCYFFCNGIGRFAKIEDGIGMRIETYDHLEALRKIVPLLPWGLNEMRSKTDPDLLRRIKPATRATMLHNVVFDEAEASFTASDGIDIGTSSGLKHFCLNDVLVRLHRAERKKLTISTNQTVQTAEWNASPKQIRLIGPDLDYRFHLVYVPDPTWTKSIDVVLGFIAGESL